MKKFRVVKTLFLLLSLFILHSAFFIPVALAQQATLSLSPSTGTFNPGCNFTVDILLNTGGAPTDGTDAILTYDTSRLTTNSTSIASGTIYPDYPGNNVDQQSGKITISGLASITSAFSGQGNLATVTFTVKPEAPMGEAPVNFDFDPNNKTNTTDANVVERGTVTDILNSVVNGAYVVGQGAGCSGSGVNQASGGISTPSAGYTQKNLDQYVGGKTGSEQLTYTIAIVGSVLTVLGIMGFALL